MKTEKMTITLPDNRKNAIRPFPLKFNRVLEDGTEVVTYVNGSGQLKDIKLDEYLKMLPQSQSASYKSLGIQTVYFKSQIMNLSEGIDSDSLRTSNLGFVIDKSKEPGKWDFFNLYPDAIFNGQQKSSSPLIKVDIVSDMKNKRTVDRKTRTDITLWLDKQSETELSDILVYFGINKGDRNKDEMINFLVEGETQISTVGEKTDVPAILFKDGNLDTFRNVFMKDADPNKKYVLAINKAKIYNLLVQSGSENNRGWYRDANFIGENDKDLIRYYITNTAPFNNLVMNIERIEGSNKVKEEKEIIAPEFKTEDINKKVELTSKLNTLVNEGKVTLPKDILVSDLSVKEMEDLISGTPTEVKEGFEGIKAGESKMQYRGRLNRKITELLKAGQIPELDQNQNSLSTADMESILQNYFKSLNQDPA